MTDVDLARLWLRVEKRAPGDVAAPAATGTWDGTVLTLRATGRPLDPAACVIAPRLAGALAAQPPPPAPTIAALCSDYAQATTAHAGICAPEGLFLERLAACRACRLWREAERGGRGRCDSVRCRCSQRLPWLHVERCPEGKWPA